ncbi:hypothetical protein FH972_009665 [Carpinus fangiana]|uniref:Bulb-type lectin domain-containing protein n=1 Tax=Carpinus fangiana TaxID=176857 RepID=A0A660KS33_9ROSI|nr:hypothetical protein FH972_009665 [Carpinus fangiana]
MAFLLLLPNLFASLLILLPISAVAQNNGNITVGSFLTATDNSSSWLSPSGDFAFGFRPLSDKNDLFLLSIWFAKIPDKTIVWYATSDTPAPRGSKVELTADEGLLLTSPQREQLWKPDTIIGTVACGVMNNTGNFALHADSNFNTIWESFQNPTDTLLPTQIMERGGVVSSRQSETSFSKGRFQLRLQQDGNLVLNTINLPTTYANEAYYASGTVADSASNLSSPGRQLRFNESGYVYILRENDQIFPLSQKKVGSADDFYFRATLDFDGVFTLYSHPRNSSSNQTWIPLWFEPENICLSSSSGVGVCGYNSICSLKADQRPACECPRGYSLLDPNDRYGSCKPDFIQGCEEDSHRADLYDFEVLLNTDWPFSDYVLLRPYTEELCRKSCMEDCMCAVAIFRLGDSCWKKKLPLSNGRVDIGLNGGKALIKIRKDNFTLPHPRSLIPEPKKKDPCLPIPEPKKKYQDTLILIGSVLLGGSVFVNVIFIGFSFIYRKKFQKIITNGSDALDDRKTLERFVMVAIWCIQEDPSLRPTMRRVIQMLEGVVEVLIPPCPFPFSNFSSCTSGSGDKLYSQTHTAIRGTKGYVAPEWFRNMPITSKVDVYSFGVLLLEIICCRRSVDTESGEEDKAILTDWAYDCFREGTLDVLVEYDREAMDDMKKVERFVKVAIWCIQEDPSLRPITRKVMQIA